MGMMDEKGDVCEGEQQYYFFKLSREGEAQ
jgi:hypothetical protein